MEYKLGSVEQEQEHRVVAKYERLKALGTEKFKEKKYEEAIKYYDAAADVIYSADGDTSSDPTRLSYYVVCKSNAAQCCINLNDFEGAIGYASCAILKDPTNAKALYRRGTSFMALFRYDSAIDDLRSCIALTLDPSTKRDVEKELKSAVNKCLNGSIIAGDLEKTKSLLEEGSDFNYRNQEGYSFLMLASQHGHLSIVELLLAKGANIHDKGATEGYSSLMLVCGKGHLDIVELLLAKGANIHDRSATNGFSSLMIASFYGVLSIVELLLSKGANIHDKATTKGYSSLMLASQQGHLKIVELLLSKGANIHDKTTPNGYSSLMLASHQGHFNIKVILEKWYVTMVFIVLKELLQGDLSNIDYPDFFINFKQYI